MADIDSNRHACYRGPPELTSWSVTSPATLMGPSGRAQARSIRVVWGVQDPGSESSGFTSGLLSSQLTHVVVS